MNWNDKSVLVTGGASFIGSHLVDSLVKRGAKYIRVVDNLSTGKEENLQEHIKHGKVVDLKKQDLLIEENVQKAFHGPINIVFHLAADHGGRGYVDLHDAQCSTNFILDGSLIKAAHEAKVEKFVFASSGCIYPNFKQTDTSKEIYLREEDAGPPYDSDNIYGYAKLMAELTLKAYYKQYGMKSASLRFFTVYGERGVENHAIMAMIARAFIKENPFEIWGDGTAIRNWTHVSDIVEGMVLAAEKIDDAQAINLGTNERIQVFDAARAVVDYVREKYTPDYEPEFKFLKDMPVGPLNRTTDYSLATKILGWEPKIKFEDGVKRVTDWYFKNKNIEEVKKIFNKKLLTEKL